MLAVMLAGCCECRKSAAAKSPDGRNEIRLRYCPAPSYEVLRDGVSVVAPTRIDLCVDGRWVADGAKVKAVCHRRLSGCEKSPVNKKASIDLSGNETSVSFGDWGVDLVARNDGVAYRLRTSLDGRVKVLGEKAGVTIPDATAKCWLCRTKRDGCEESVAETCEAGKLAATRDDMAYLPLIFSVGGKFAAVAESDVRDYPVWNLARVPGEGPVEMEGVFPAWPGETRRTSWGDKTYETGGRNIRVKSRLGHLVETDGSRTYPWRVVLLADEPCRFCEAGIVKALAAPPDPGADFSWVKPGKVAWDWWNNFDNGAGCNTRTYERFIDFASKNGVEYVIFDEGWSEDLDIWKFHRDVDVPHLVKYADERGVGIILWMAWAQAYGDEERVVKHFAKLGAKGFKVDFIDRGDADAVRFVEKFAAECAKERMLVDYHGAYRPTGLERKYPNILNFEGVHGLEQMKWHKSDYDFMLNDVRAFFLRMTAGPMDYTPGAMLNHARGTYKPTGDFPGSYGTRCRQIAMMAAYEAPLQMLCDSPSLYEKNMECFCYMAATPVVWDDTVGLGGDPDSFAAVARRSGDVWYAAGLSSWDARDFSIDTKFLGEGEWNAEIFRDAPDSDVNATAYVHETKKVKAGQALAVHMAPGGGFSIRFSK